MYDRVILGGGPAGLTAAAYALNKHLETLVITEDLGGKTNYHFRTRWLEGDEMITGIDIVNRFRRPLEDLSFAHELDRAIQVTQTGDDLNVSTKNGKTFQTRALVVATDTTPKRLGASGEMQFIGRGLSYSAVSHASFFLDREVALIGQGEAVLKSATELALVARKLLLILINPQDLTTELGKKPQDNPKVKIITGYQVLTCGGQVLIALGEGAKAALSVYEYLSSATTLGVA